MNYSISNSNFGSMASSGCKILSGMTSYSLSTFDVSRNLVVSGVYSLPFGRGQPFGAHWNRLVDALLADISSTESSARITETRSPSPLRTWPTSSTRASALTTTVRTQNWRLRESRLTKYSIANFSQPLPTLLETCRAHPATSAGPGCGP